MQLLTLQEVSRLVGGLNPLLNSSTIGSYCVDSRSLKQGGLFFALKGQKVDGHCFLDEARARGAIGAVVSKDYQCSHGGLALIRVHDPLFALQSLAKAILLMTQPRVVAITGSVGKTSTKEFVKILLSAQYCVTASPGNQNSQVGMPLTILNEVSGKEDILVLEMGMSLKGHLTKLVEIAPPEVAVITSVALVHACNFNSIEEIARAKAEIFSSYKTSLGILHCDIPIYEEIAKTGLCRKTSFSFSSQCADYKIASDDHRIVEASIEGKKICIGNIPVFGNHQKNNLLAAIAVARYFDIDWSVIVNTIPLLKNAQLHSKLVYRGTILFYNDSYNASEISIKSALESLPIPKNNGKKIAVLGSMLELGQFSFESHYRVGQHALDYVEKIYCLGEECRPIHELWQGHSRSTQLFHCREDLVKSLKVDLNPDDVVLLKGSHQNQLWKILEEI